MLAGSATTTGSNRLSVEQFHNVVQYSENAAQRFIQDLPGYDRQVFLMEYYLWRRFECGEMVTPHELRERLWK